MSENSKIRFQSISQIELMPDQLIIEDVPERESPLDIPKEEGIVLAGVGTNRNPKHQRQTPGVYLVRKVGSDVSIVKPGDWVLLTWRAVMPESECCLNNFSIKEGDFAVCIEGSIAAKVRSASAVH
jgi:hypothetical protein